MEELLQSVEDALEAMVQRRYHLDQLLKQLEENGRETNARAHLRSAQLRQRKVN